MFRRRIRVFYPLEEGRLVLRTAQDWWKDIDPVAVDGQRYEFDIVGDRPALEFKPCIHRGDQLLWSQGPNKLTVLTTSTPRDVYPHFDPNQRSYISGRRTLVSDVLGRGIEFRVYYPPGYDENYLTRYPVLYMHDGRNLFFPEEAFLGREWEVDETLDRLDTMNLIHKILVVGLHSERRMEDYTQPGYENFGRALVEELKPMLDERLRTHPDARRTAAMGSSLGGVAAFHLAWNWPHVFGNAACLSSTFDYRDDLIQRVRSEPAEPRRDVRFYLDSGWPNDNYETTLGMAHALMDAGFEFGTQFMHFAFPLAQHHEAAWAARSHIPLQLFSGKLAARRFVDD